MRVLEIIAKERNITLQQLFEEGFQFTYQRECRAPEQLRTLWMKYVRTGVMPDFMSTWLRCHPKPKPEIPLQASQAYHKFQITKHFRLIDPEPGSVLVARRCKDGVYRTN